MHDNVNIIKAQTPMNDDGFPTPFLDSLVKLCELEEKISAKIRPNIDFECRKSLKKALTKAKHHKLYPKDYAQVLLNILPLCKMYLGNEDCKIIDEVIADILYCINNISSTESMESAEKIADMYLSKVFKDYKPIMEEVNV